MKRLEHCNGFFIPIGCLHRTIFFLTFQIFARTINGRQDDNYDVMMIYAQRS